MSIDSAMMEIWGERFDGMRCSFLMGRTKSFYASQSIVITCEIWQFNGGEESPSEAFTALLLMCSTGRSASLETSPSALFSHSDVSWPTTGEDQNANWVPQRALPL